MNDRVGIDTQSGVQPVMGLVGIDENIAPGQFSDDESGGRLAEAEERISIARVKRIHVGHGVNAIAAVAGAGRFADIVDGLVADPAAFQKLLLHQGAVVKPRPAFVGSPR